MKVLSVLTVRSEFSFASPSLITSAGESTEEKGQLNSDLVKQFVDAQVYLGDKKSIKTKCWKAETSITMSVILIDLITVRGGFGTKTI